MEPQNMPSNTVKANRTSLWPVFLGVVLIEAFFLTHQAWSTGFFTKSFGLVEAVLFYGVILSGLVPPVIGSLHLRKKSELSFLLLAAVFWTVAAAWFYIAFPFDFTHLTAVVPSVLSFLLSWVTNRVGRVLLGVAFIGALAFVPFFTLQLAKAGRAHTLNLPSA